MANSFKMCVETTIHYQTTFEWTIDIFSKLPVGWIEKSEEFNVEADSSWCIKFRKEPNVYYLYLCRNDGRKFKANCILYVLNSKNQILYTFKKSYENLNELDLLPGDFVWKTKYLPEDRLIFRISITVKNLKPFIVKENLLPSASEEVLENQQKTLSRDLKRLFDKGIKTDVTFNIQGESKLSAHKIILVARSEVFARMFQEGMTEEDNSVVDIQDIDLTTMKILLSFMYSAKLEECDFDAALEVYRAADKYAIADLRDACVHVLTSKTTMENVTELLYTAEMHCDKELKEKAFQCIASHHKPNKREHHEKS